MFDDMTPERALDIVDGVCARFQGNRQDHEVLKKAIIVLRQMLAPPVGVTTPTSEPVNGEIVCGNRI